MNSWIKRIRGRRVVQQTARLASRRRRLTLESLENRRVLAAILSGEEFTDSLAIGQIETFDFSLASPGTIRVAVGQNAGATGTPRVSIVDSSGTVVAGPSTGSDDVTLQVTGQLAGDYQAIVAETNQDEPLDYRIRVLTLPSTPITISGRDSSSLDNGERAASSVDVGSFNVHRFTLTQPSRFRISVGQDAGAIGDPEVTIFGPDGSIVAPAATGPDDVSLQLVDQAAGTYTAVVADFENNEVMDYYVRLLVLADNATGGTISPIPGRDSGDLANGLEIASSIEVGSFNFHRFTIPTGGDASLFVSQDAGDVGQPAITIFDSAGNVAAPINTGTDEALGRLVGLSAGTYTAVVEDSNNDEPLNYRLRLLSFPGTPVPIDERDSAELGNGEFLTSSLPIGSANFHQFVMPSSGTFRVAVGQDAVSPGSPQLTIFRPDGTALGNVATGDDHAMLQFVNQPAGRYTALVAEAGGELPLDYHLRLLTLPGTLAPIAGRDSIPLGNGEQIDASVPLGSFNVHTVEVGAAGTLVLSLGQNAGAAGQPELTIFSAGGTIVPVAGDSATTGIDGITARLTGLAEGTYTVVVSDAAGDEAMDYHVRALSLDETAGTPTVITGRDSSPLANGDEFASTLNVGEFSFHRFTVDSDAAVRIGITQDANAIGNPELTIYDNTGALVAGPTTAVDGFALTLSDVGSGTYTAVVTEAESDSPMAYRIRLLAFPGTPTPIDGRDSASLASGDEVTSRIEVGGFNFHSFTVPALGEVRLFLGQDADENAGLDGQPEITVLDSLGNVVREPVSGVNEVNVTLNNLDSGTYTAIVSEADDSEAITYRLRLLALPGNPVTLPAREPTLAGSSPVSGSVPVGSFGLFPFKATSGDDVTVRVVEESTTSQAEPQFEVLDSGGNFLVSQNGTESATRTFRAPENGKYYVVVTDGNSDEALDFNITVTGNRLPPPIATISPASQTADESAGAVTFDVNLDCAWETDITIPIVLTGSATDGIDYTISSSNVTIPVGSVSVTVTIDLIDDFDDESDTETIIATLGSASLIELGSAITHTITINDNDDPPPLATITSPSQTVDEDDGTVTFDVVLSSPAPGEVNIPFTLTGSATQNEDFSIQSSPITIATGQSSATVFVNVLDDTNDEPDQETLVVTLGNPDRAVLGLETIHTVTINDNDLPPPTVSFELVSQDSDEDSGTQTVEIVLSGVATEPVLVPLIVTGTATQDSDYTITESPVVIPIGSTTASVVITVIDDTVDEENQETVIVSIGDPSGATRGDVTVHTLSINDNDLPSITASVGSTTQTVTESVGTLNFEVQLSANATSEVRVPFSISGTAVSGEDFTIIDASPAIIAAGSQSTAVSFSILNDSVIETSETLIVTLGEPTGAILGSEIVHTATINDDDVNLPTINFTAATSSFVEADGTVLAFELTLSAAQSSAFLVPFSVSGTAESTDVGGTDYSIPSSPLLIPAGAETQQFFVIINDDPTEEPDESVIVTLEPSSDYRLGLTTIHTVTIVDNDTPVIPDPTINVAIETQTVDEEAGTVTFEILLSAASSVPVTVPISLSGTATRNADYTTTTTSVTIPVGSTSATVVFNVIDDTSEETAQETIIATLGTPTGAVRGTSLVHTVLINDNDSPPPFVSVSAVSQTANENLGSATFDVLLSSALSQDVTVPVTLLGTATDGTDYTIAASPVVIPAGDTSVPFTITIIDDTIDERTGLPAGQPDGETVVVTLGQPIATGLVVDLGPQSVHTLTIDDDDAPPLSVSLSSFQITVPEDVGTYQFDLVLSQTSTTDVTVPFTVSGTATDGSDYTFTASPARILAGQTSTTLIVTVLDDDDVDSTTETIVIALGTPVGATLSGNTIHTATIFDNESNLAVVNITPAVRTVGEDAGTVSFDVTLSSALDQAVTVPFTLSGTATDAMDYTFTASPLTIPAGLTSINAVITVLDDPDDEVDQETLIVTLGTPTGADLGASFVHTLTINDNDDPLPTLQVTSVSQSAAESAGFVTFDIALSAATNRVVTIPFSVTGTAIETADFSITASPVTIAAGDTSARVTISILEDQADEASQETVVVTLGTPSGAVLGANAIHTVTIIDNDDPPPVLTVTPSVQTAREDAGTRSFEIVLSAAATQPITVPFSLSGAATQGSDYTFTASPLTIPVGVTRITANVVVIDDTIDEADTETFIMTLGTPSGATLGSSVTHTLTIIDNDEPVVVLPTVSVSTATQVFGENEGTLSVDVRLSSVSTTPVTVPIGLSGGATPEPTMPHQSPVSPSPSVRYPQRSISTLPTTRSMRQMKRSSSRSAHPATRAWER